MSAIEDEILFGWDPTPGIVSVWADSEGQALVWRRIDGKIRCERERFYPWLLATTLAELDHLGAKLAAVRSRAAAPAPSIPPAPPLIRYRELDGDAGSYRYLLAARSGRALVKAIVAGASRRLSRRIHGLSELDGYYRVGPVEQYLMQTGRVYFRGLHYDDLRRMQIDLETTALDPHAGRIFLCAVRDTQGLAVTLEARTPAEEPRLIESLCALVRERDPDVIENHNLFGFDLPFLEHRAGVHGVPLRLGRPDGPALLERQKEGGPGRGRRPRYTLAGRELIDTLDAVRRHDFVARTLPSHRLKDVARHFGVARPERVYLRGAETHDVYLRDPERVQRYALDDVAEVDALSRRLLRAPFALAGMAPRRYERLASAGPATGVLEPILVRAYLHARTALPGPQGGGEGLDPHEGGALHLFATGVARHVVKADIASLYPSLMRAYRIGPACDRRGVLLHVVERLLDLRLAHKAAARQAAAGSLEHGHHEALQAAMKLLINSAYGYMGAGQLALFADRRAADEVTRRGREILDRLVAALRARGVALIEADTDGVYFAVPEGTTEADERALVAAVAAELPAGIRLEYEGRYRAMFSHEVKNYALLPHGAHGPHGSPGDGGEVILRGVALRSSRAEPFGERFLREALRRTMLGDVVGLRGLFLETLAAIERRALPTAAVATRARLSKSPEEYLATRAGHREAPYEALLGAGRTQWVPGERVRYYRARGGGQVYIWLPDEDDDARRADEDRRDYDVEHYRHVLVASYASRLRKAFATEDFERLFRLDEQFGLFDRPIDTIQPLWIRCPTEIYRPGVDSPSGT
ncbi:MAG TPA: DNA polymerase domain-containing protein [Polyangia bacterium]|jgi:DNA polymerase elongation subunit (family B)|nr:DNA polymerase domain-containing protein [Polyangia bacterium]